MKKSSIIVAACLVVCGLFLTQPAFAALSLTDYSGGWAIENGETSILFDPSGDSFGIYDTADADTIISLNPVINYLSVTDDGQWLLNNTELAISGGSFGVCFFDGDNTVYTYDVYMNSRLGGFELVFGDAATLFISDAQANQSSGGSETPVPTAMLLLGTGLVGLAGFKRRIDEN